MNIEDLINGNHHWTRSWGFESIEVCKLADAMASEAEKNGVGKNDFRHIFTMTLRMIKSNDGWAK